MSMDCEITEILTQNIPQIDIQSVYIHLELDSVNFSSSVIFIDTSLHYHAHQGLVEKLKEKNHRIVWIKPLSTELFDPVNNKTKNFSFEKRKLVQFSRIPMCKLLISVLV